MTATVRFAPSPTGRIHIGNARTALINWLFAKGQGGRFILRFDDTDRERSREEYAQAIAQDLAWLGIIPDAVHRQSERFAAYDAAAGKLKAAGRLYPCYETPEELERKRKLQLARHKPPVYDRAALELSEEERRQFEAQGRQPHWRFSLEARGVAWRDLVRGNQTIDAASLSDPVLIRADGTYLYTLTSVVDDIDMGVTHVIRGEDHVANTGVQIELFEALGARPPIFAHHSLLVAAGGEGLSKRTGALSIASLRERGLEPMAVASLATLIGTSEAVRPCRGLAELAALFDIGKLSRAPAHFDPAELDVLNAKLLHALAYDEVAARLEALGIGGGEPFWQVVRGNLRTFGDALTWWRVVEGPIDPVIEDAAFTQAAADLLPDEPWDGATWKRWTGAVAEATGRKGRALFHPLRLALTGCPQGPELAGLLPLIGKSECAARLRQEASSG